MDDLSEEYDVIIIGTGLCESIVAAAASRIGKSVLHVDGNEYYGGDWASFNLDNLQTYLEKDNQQLKQNSNVPYRLKNGNNIYNVVQNWHIDDDINYKWKKSEILKEYRKFNIDLTPKLLFFKGHLIQLLITSNISRYAEFRSVTRVLTLMPCEYFTSSEKKFKLLAVPCSRSDVFASKNVNVVEKRMLMKLLNSCISFNSDDENSEFKDFANKTFLSYLKHKKLTDNLIHYVLYAIAMGNSEIGCTEGILRTKRFLSSLGYYGNTPFLYPMYGNGEISQYFCRLCAVFGGTYCLKRPVNNIIIDSLEQEDKMKNNECISSKRKKFKEVVCGSQNLKSNYLVMGAALAPDEFNSRIPKNGLSRGIFITDRSVLEDEHESLTLLKIPPIQDFSETVVLEVGKSSYVCPDGLYIVHMTSRQNINAQADLQPLAEKLFEFNFNYESMIEKSGTEENDTSNDVKEEQICNNTTLKQDRPHCLWSLYFNMPDTSECDFTKWDVPENILLCGGPDIDLDYDHAVEEARMIFTKMYPDCEFLPRAPDPEEIIFGESDENNEDQKSEKQTDNNESDALKSKTYVQSEEQNKNDVSNNKEEINNLKPKQEEKQMLKQDKDVE